MTEEGSTQSSPITATFRPNDTSIQVTVPIVSGGGLSFEIALTDPVNASLGFDKGDVSTVISNGVSVASAIASYNANQIVSPATVSDSAQNVASNLDTLQNIAAAGKLAAITLTDSGTPTLTITPVQTANDATVLGLISGNYHAAVTGRAFDVGHNLDALQTLASASRLGAVTFTDAGTPTVTISPSQEIADAQSLADISGAYNLSVVGSTGINTVAYSGNMGTYAITHQSDGTLTLVQPTGTGRTDTLTNVQRIQFGDVKLALDMGTTQASGETALLIGAVLGKSLAFANDPIKETVLGNVIALFDQSQYNMQILAGALMRLNHDNLDIWTLIAGGNDLTHIAQHVLTVVNGQVPDQATLSAAVTALTAEAGSLATQGTWLANEALSAANQAQVNLVGLAAAGMVYQ